METKILKIRQESGLFSPEEEAGLRLAGEVIKGGGLVAFPTETVYGLGGDALNPESARKIYAAKGRPSDNPLIIHICRFEDMRGIVREVPREAEIIADVFWPGPITMILPKAENVPYETTGGLDTVAVRFPSHPVARKLIAYGGGYIAAPSANISGRPSPTAARHVTEDMNGRIEMILDAGDAGIGLESTILDLTSRKPVILRPGFVTREMLDRVLGKVDTDAAIVSPDSGQAPKAPGMKYRHYAPSAELVVVDGEMDVVVDEINRLSREKEDAGCSVGIIATEETVGRYRTGDIKCVGTRADESTVASHLYGILREFDRDGVEYIYSEAFAAEGIGSAVMNRLLKAAGHHVLHV